MRSMFNTKNPYTVLHNIKGFTPAKSMSYDGIHMDEWKKIEEWKKHPDTKSAWISQKRRSLSSALKEFRELNNVSEFFMRFQNQTANFKDDVLEVFYRVKVGKVTDTASYFDGRAAFFA